MSLTTVPARQRKRRLDVLNMKIKQYLFQMGRAWSQIILIHPRKTKSLLAPSPIAVTFKMDKLKHQISAVQWYYWIFLRSK